MPQIIGALRHRLASRLGAQPTDQPGPTHPFEPPTRMSPSVADGFARGRITLGRWSYVLATLKYFDTTTNVTVGSFCSIAEDVVFLLGGGHRADWVTTSPLRILMREPGAGSDGTPTSDGDIVVGNDVWIAYGATIASGVHIGDGAIVGTRSVVLDDVPPYAIVAGSPARVVRHRFDEPTREALLRVQWWNWPDHQVRAAIPYLCSADLPAFLHRQQQLPTADG